MSDNLMVENGYSKESGAECQPHTYKHEIINVLMRREDYETLKQQGGLRPDQISMALRHYLKLIAEKRWLPETMDAANRESRFATFQCSISKDLWDGIRNLGGRIDSHTVEALRLFLL